MREQQPSRTAEVVALQRALDQRRDVHWTTLKCHRPRIGKQLVEQAIDAVDLGLYDLGILAERSMVCQLALQHLSGGASNAERIADLVREAACEPAEGGQALRSLHLFFKRAHLGQIVEYDDRADRLAFYSQ